MFSILRGAHAWTSVILAGKPASRRQRDKSLRHVAMAATFLDDNKPKVNSHRFKLHRSKILAKLSGVESERTVFEFRKRKKKFLCCVHQLHKAGAWNWEVSSRRLATTAKKCSKKCDARAKLLFCFYEPIAFPFSLPSPLLLLKLSIVVIQKAATMVTWRHTPPLYC